MKRLLLLCLLAFAGTAHAQQQAVISGEISEPSHDSIRISYYTNLVNFEKKTIGAPLSPDGLFSITIPLEKPVAAFLEHNYDIIELYLQPGDQLNVTFDAKEIEESLEFKGEGALENNCLAEMSKLQDDEDFNHSKKSIYADDQVYLKLVDEKFSWQEKYAEKYMKKNNVSEDFKRWLRCEIKFGGALQKLQFTELRGTIVKIDDPYKVSPNFYSFISAAEAYPNPDNSSLCYINYKNELVRHEHRKITTNPQQADFYATQFKLAQSLLDGEPEAIVTGRLVIDAFKKGQVNYAEQILADYKKQSHSKPYISLVQTAADYYKPLARGSMAPDLPLYDVQGKKISLSSLQGKAVYIYFYTLGCGSCQMEIAGARELANRLENQNVAFLFVSVDQDRETWKKVISRRPWPGVTGQTADSAATIRNYRLNQFPSALILDPEGRIYDKEAKRLNSLELQGNLEAVLNEKRTPVHGQLLPKEGSK